VNNLNPIEQASILYLDETPVFDEYGNPVPGDELQHIIQLDKLVYFDVEYR
jgi:hypothetical protein